MQRVFPVLNLFVLKAVPCNRMTLAFYCCPSFFKKYRYPMITTDALKHIFITFAYLSHFSPMFHFYNAWKYQKTFRFFNISGGIAMDFLTLLGGIEKWVNELIGLNVKHATNQKTCFGKHDKKQTNRYGSVNNYIVYWALFSAIICFAFEFPWNSHSCQK